MLAEECKQCTKLAILTFTNQTRPPGIFFRLSLLWTLEMVQNIFHSVTFVVTFVKV